MKQTCLLISVVLFAIPCCSGECEIQSVRGTPQYLCSTLQDLQQQENSLALDVSVNKPSDVSEKKLNIKIVLLQEVTGSGLSSETSTLLKEISNLFKPNLDVGVLPSRIFANLPIKELHFYNNGITNIELGAFSTLGSIGKIYIVDNKLSTARKGIFNNLPLSTLALSRNRITFVEKDAFTSMPRLKQLHLDGNRLMEFQPEIVMNNPHVLEELLLQNNVFTEIDRNTVRGLANLKLLNLDGNKISHCASYTFEDAPNIEVLALGNNLLEDFKAEAFPTNGLQKLRKLDLHNNRLSYVTALTLERLRTLTDIRIGGNPWQCPCMDVLLLWLYEHNVQQKCDKDYYNGTRPICTVDDDHPFRCVYEYDNHSYQRYNEINKKYPHSECSLFSVI